MVRPAALPSSQTAVRLGKIAHHEDIQPVSLRQFAINIATRSRGWTAPTGTAPGFVTARVDAGRWLADCPLECGGAELVSEIDPVFLCLSCGSNLLWWPVHFPPNKAEIEGELLKRKDVAGWTWNPGESIAQLQAETARLAAEV